MARSPDFCLRRNNGALDDTTWCCNLSELKDDFSAHPETVEGQSAKGSTSSPLRNPGLTVNAKARRKDVGPPGFPVQRPDVRNLAAAGLACCKVAGSRLS